MNLIVANQVEKFLDQLSPIEKARVRRSQELFKEFGLQLPAKYLKRMVGTQKLWELRAGNIRLFFFSKGKLGVIVHALKKKTNKTPKQDIQLAEKRQRELGG